LDEWKQLWLDICHRGSTLPRKTEHGQRAASRARIEADAARSSGRRHGIQAAFLARLEALREQVRCRLVARRIHQRKQSACGARRGLRAAIKQPALVVSYFFMPTLFSWVIGLMVQSNDETKPAASAKSGQVPAMTTAAASAKRKTHRIFEPDHRRARAFVTIIKLYRPTGAILRAS
jgi:hypothetical protein